MGEITINAADGVSFEIEKGEFAVIVGASGAGKTTILNMARAAWIPAMRARSLLTARTLATFNKKQLTTYRRYDIGFVFQFYNLVNNLTAKENVELATQICAHASQPEEVLKKVGLEDRMNNFPSQLSGGEQQRVSIARALAKNPKLLLCDEPTGALDYNTGKNILRLLQYTCRNDGVTVIVITHNSAIAPMADRVITVKNSKVDKVEINKDPVDVSTIEW